MTERVFVGPMASNTIRYVISGFIILGLAFAAPTAMALSVGTGAEGFSDMKSAGATPKYGQVWAGAWVKSHGWSHVEKEIRTVRDSGATPVILWYYWGDGISENAVKYGSGGKSRGEWDAMAKELAKRTKAIMGSKTFIIVLEPEFNKNGVQHWESFDGYLANQARIIKAEAPSAKTVVGFGHWGGWSIFDRAVAASDYVGFQYMRASTRDSAWKAENSAADAVEVAKKLRSMFGKKIVLFDLAISTYGGWEGVQERALQKFISKRTELSNAGVDIIIWRYVRDNSLSSGYYGSAEKHWGVKYSSGGNKRSWDEMVTLVKGSTSSSSSTSTSSSSSTSTSSSSVFSNVKGNSWWVEANVAGGPAKVDARVNGGSWTSLSKTSWGSWAKSMHAPSGSTVDLRATYSDGKTASVSYKWGSSPSLITSSSSTSSSSSLSASFSNVQVKEWWVQTTVKADKSLSKVEVRVNGGSWMTIQKQSWGDYARSVKVPSGGSVEFKATATDGSSRVSGKYWR